MEILFLGTSSGAPTKTRNVSAIALCETKGRGWYLIDCGEGTQHQLLKTRLSTKNLRAIFITHTHGDHCFGLPGLLASAGLNGRTSALTIVAPEGIRQWVEHTQQLSDTYLPYDLDFVAADGLQLGMGEFAVSALELSHRVQSFAYVFTQAMPARTLNVEKIAAAGIPQGPLWGALQAGKDVQHNGAEYSAEDFTDAPEPKKVIICGDNDQPQLLSSVCDGCDLLVHESTFTADMADQAKNVGHCYARQVAEFAQTQRIPNLILTHVSARYSDYGDEIEQEAAEVYTGNLFVARDFHRYQLKEELVMVSAER